jgi:hypothetical protein
LADSIEIQVELYGTPRLRVGRRDVELRLPAGAMVPQVTAALADACPQLVGHAVREDRSGLQDGFVFNHNGLTFLDDGASVPLQPGDSLLLLSGQSGG